MSGSEKSYTHASFDGTSILSSAAQETAKNAHAVAQSFALGLQSVEEVRAQVLATGISALNAHAAGLTALAKIRTPAEAFELQQQLAGQLVTAYSTNAKALSTAFTSAVVGAWKPLTDRLAEVSKATAKA